MKGLVCEGLSFSYPTRAGERPVLCEVSFAVRPGEVLGVVGPNGAGKSTVVRLLTRLHQPEAGRITLEGTPLATFSRLELARRVAVVPQSSELPAGFSALELVMMGRTPHLGFLAAETPADHALVETVMRRTNIWAFREREVQTLSGGERQRVLLARALAQEPEYLLLDEPTNHLDVRYQLEVLRQLRREVLGGLGALVVLHDLNLAARVCDRVLVLHEGRVVASGPPAEVLRAPLLREVYQTELTVFAQPGSGTITVMPEL